MLVKGIMTSDVRLCSPETTLAAVARIKASRDCGIVPVVDSQHKRLDIVTDRDICLAVATKCRTLDELPVGEIMTRKLYTCSPDDEARTAEPDEEPRYQAPAGGERRWSPQWPDLDRRLAVRADRHKEAAVSAEDVLDAFRAICVLAVAA